MLVAVKLLTLLQIAQVYVSGLSLSHNEQPLNNNGGEPQGTLLFATILYRHGDRTPIDPYPTDPVSLPTSTALLTTHTHKYSRATQLFRRLD